MGSLISCATSECLGTCKGEEACQACIDKTCGAAFATCTGLYNSKSASLNISGLVGPPVSFTRQKAGACTGEKDNAIWSAGGDVRFGNVSWKCGHQCTGSTGCSAACMNGNEGYSPDCSWCMGSLISCSASQCLGTCGDVHSCAGCIYKTCGAAFVNCTGLNFSSSFAATASAVSKTLLLEEFELSLRAENASKSGAACMGKSDQMIWTGGGEVEFGEVAGDCGEECLGNALCAARCLHVEEGYSPNCSFCMGGLVNCVVSQCYGACNDLKSCASCIRTSCSPAFGNCSGLQNIASALAQNLPNCFTDNTKKNTSVRAALRAPRSTEDGGACKGVEDQKIWTSGGDQDFAGVSAACGRRCFGRKSCSSHCIVKQKGYSQKCGRCMGTLVSCTVSKCLVACWPEGSDTCKQCIRDTCNSAFANCSGVENPATESKKASALPPPGLKASGLRGGSARSECIGCGR